MRFLFNMICFAPEGSAGGEGNAPAADGADKAAPKANDAAASAPAEGKGGGDKPDAASSQKADPAANAKPPGDPLADLIGSVPDAFRGKDAAETIQKLMEGHKSERAHISKYGIAPEKIEDYAYQPSENLAKDFFTGSDEDKKLTDAVLTAFQKNGVGKMQATGLMNDVISSVVQAFDLKPAVNVEKERAALLPADAIGLPAADQKTAIDARINDALDFVNTLERQGMDAGAVNVLASILSEAGGVRLVEFIKANLRGDGLAVGGLTAGAGSLAELEKLRQDPRYNNDMKFRADVQSRILAAKGKA